MPSYIDWPNDPTYLPTLGGVPYLELADGLEEGSDDQGSWAHKSYIVNWGDRFDFVQGLRGNSGLQADAGSAWIRGIPFQYPDNAALYAGPVSIRPEGELLNKIPIAWQYAVVTVTFRTPTWDYLPTDDPFNLNQIDPNTPIPYAEQELDAAVEYMQVPTGGLVDINGHTLLQAVYRRVGVLRLIITFHDLPYIPMGKIQALIDKVNDATFLGCARGTVMIESVKTARRRSPDGTILQGVILALKWRQQDWNKITLSDGTWDLPYKKLSNGDPDTTNPVNLYQYTSYTPILFLGQSVEAAQGSVNTGGF